MNAAENLHVKGFVVRCREIVRRRVVWFSHAVLRYVYRMNVSRSARISFGARLDKTNPKGIVIGDESYVASGAVILSHDFCRGLKATTTIGKRCFIGANAIVLPGITIGDCVVVGAGSVVTKNIPAGCIVVGNPAKVIAENVETGRFGQIVSSSCLKENKE